MAQPVARKVVVDVPHRISGFFKIVDHTLPLDYGLDDLLSIGSRGGGPCLSECGVTAIEIDEHGESGSVKIFINGEDCADGAKTTRSVLKWMAGEAVNDIAITIKHDFPMLMGAGYGSSGSGALGTAIALNVLLDMGLSLNDCGKFAHCAEVENKTGLGTIGGQVRVAARLALPPGFRSRWKPSSCLLASRLPARRVVVSPRHRCSAIQTFARASLHRERRPWRVSWSISLSSISRGLPSTS